MFEALIKSIDYLKKTQAGDQQDLWKRLDYLEKNVAMSQEEATQWVVKKLKEDQTFTFKKKGNEKSKRNVKNFIVGIKLAFCKNTYILHENSK